MRDHDEKNEHWAFRWARHPATKVCITVLVTVLQALAKSRGAIRPR